MTVQRPDLTADELRDARDAWMLARLGQPIPTQYRPAAQRAALYALACGYDHDDAAEARPVFLHPDGGAEGVPGVYGVNRTWTVTHLGAWIAQHTATAREKGTGPMYSPGHSHRADDHDEDGEAIAGAFPMAPHQRGDDRCRALGWVFLDADASGDWHALVGALGMHGAAYVRSRSSGHCPAGRGCAQHPHGTTKWHLALPLRSTWTPPEHLALARIRWKSELYPAARFVLHLAGELTGRGFDRELAQFLCRMYVGAPRDREHLAVDREVRAQEGLGFDAVACFAALEDLGVVDPAHVRAEQTAGLLASAGRAWDLDDGTPPMVAAFLVAGLYGHQLTSGNHTVVCPWESLHTGGEAHDTSTILFPNGKFHCSHSHAEGKAAGGVGMREVLAMLPAEAQSAHEQARREGRARARLVGDDGESLSVERGSAPPCADPQTEREVLAAILRDEALPPRPAEGPSAWDRVRTVIVSADFAVGRCGALYEAMTRAKAAGRPLLPAILRDELRGMGGARCAGGLQALGELAAVQPPAAHVDAAALVIADLSAKRRLGRELADGMRSLIAGKPLAEVHSSVLRKVREVRLPGAALPTMADAMKAAGQRFDARRSGVVDRVLRSSVRDLNEALEGGWRCGLHILGARPFIGKTVLATQEVVFTASHAGPVLYLSLESREAEITDAMIAFLSGVELDRVKTPATLTQAEFDAVDQAMAQLERLPVTVMDMATDGCPLTVPQIEAAVMRMPTPPVLIAIDHLRKLQPTRRGQEPRHALGEISQGLHELAKDHGLAILGLMHVGRSAVKGQLARVPTMEDLKESGDLEENADGVVMLHNEGRYPTKKYAKGDEPSRDMVDVYVPKVRGARGGGYAKLRLHGALQRFASTVSPEWDLDTRATTPRPGAARTDAGADLLDTYGAGDGLSDVDVPAAQLGFDDLGPQDEAAGAA